MNEKYDRVGLLYCKDHSQEVLVMKKSLASGHWELVCPRCDFWFCLDCPAGRDKKLEWHEFPYFPEGTLPKALADFDEKPVEPEDCYLPDADEGGEDGEA